MASSRYCPSLQSISSEQYHSIYLSGTGLSVGVSLSIYALHLQNAADAHIVQFQAVNHQCRALAYTISTRIRLPCSYSDRKSRRTAVGCNTRVANTEPASMHSPVAEDWLLRKMAGRRRNTMGDASDMTWQAFFGVRSYEWMSRREVKM